MADDTNTNFDFWDFNNQLPDIDDWSQGWQNIYTSLPDTDTQDFNYPYTPSPGYNWSDLIKDAGKILSGASGAGKLGQLAGWAGIASLLNKFTGAQSQVPTGYQGGIPQYTASRQQYAFAPSAQVGMATDDQIRRYISQQGLTDPMVAQNMINYGVSPQRMAGIASVPVAEVERRYLNAFGPNLSEGYRRPGSGGLTYFSPMQYTPVTTQPPATTAPPPAASTTPPPGTTTNPNSFNNDVVTSSQAPAPAPASSSQTSGGGTGGSSMTQASQVNSGATSAQQQTGLASLASATTAPPWGSENAGYSSTAPAGYAASLAGYDANNVPFYNYIPLSTESPFPNNFYFSGPASGTNIFNADGSVNWSLFGLGTQSIPQGDWAPMREGSDAYGKPMYKLVKKSQALAALSAPPPPPPPPPSFLFQGPAVGTNIYNTDGTVNWAMLGINPSQLPPGQWAPVIYDYTSSGKPRYTLKPMSGQSQITQALPINPMIAQATQQAQQQQSQQGIQNAISFANVVGGYSGFDPAHWGNNLLQSAPGMTNILPSLDTSGWNTSTRYVKALPGYSPSGEPGANPAGGYMFQYDPEKQDWFTAGFVDPGTGYGYSIDRFGKAVQKEQDFLTNPLSNIPGYAWADTFSPSYFPGSIYSFSSPSPGMAAGGVATLPAAKGRFVQGPGDGVSDHVPATIEGNQPARLADGEFVLPARIVSELGNGSSAAGARKLYAFMDRVERMTRNAKRGKPSGADKLLNKLA